MISMMGKDVSLGERKGAMVALDRRVNQQFFCDCPCLLLTTINYIIMQALETVNPQFDQ